jgi:hypothetical protein
MLSKNLFTTFCNCKPSSTQVKQEIPTAKRNPQVKYHLHQTVTAKKNKRTTEKAEPIEQ